MKDKIKYDSFLNAIESTKAPGQQLGTKEKPNFQLKKEAKYL